MLGRTGRVSTHTHRSLHVGVALGVLLALGASRTEVQAQCTNTVYADVVALDQVLFWNPLGPCHPQGLM